MKIQSIGGSLFLTVLVLVSTEGAIGQGILRDITNRMDKHYRSLQTLQANIERSMINVQIDHTDLLQGKVVMKPGKGRDFAMRLDWVKPKAEVLTVVNGQYVLFVPGMKRAYYGSSDSHKVSTSGGNALGALNMSNAELRANYTPTYIGEETIKDATRTFHIRLTPKTKQKFKTSDLWIDSDGMPRQVMITALNGDTDTFFLSGIKKNLTIDRSVFKVNVGDAEKVEQ